MLFSESFDKDSDKAFVFGQNMDQRAIQPTEENEQEGGVENGEASGVSSTTGSSILKPSAFPAASSMIAPSKFQVGANPWKSQPAENTDSTISSSDTSGVIASNQMVSSSNPFAERVQQTSVSAPGSDSEEDRKDKPVVAPSHFKPARAFSSAPKVPSESASPAKCLLRPSTLDKQTSQFKGFVADSNSAPKTSFKLEPAKLHSPFSVKHKAGDSNNKENEKAREVDTTKPGLSDEANERLLGASPSFSSEASVSTSESSQSAKQTNNGALSSEGGFVFGQKMGERATAVSSSSSASAFTFGEKLGEKQAEEPEAGAAASSSTAQSPDKESISATDPSNGSSAQFTLAESAAAEQAKLEIPSYEEVEVTTGEENESNVFHLNAKLYAFDSAQRNWCEKGRGALRLNDKTNPDDTAFQSRLVMRAQGSLRVILNTKVWAGQTIERAAPKSVKLSAWDIEENAVKIFLIQASNKEADQIFSAIDWRIQQLKVEEQNKPDNQKDDCDEHPEASGRYKRQRDPDEVTPPKKQRIDGDHRKVHHPEESNDSSTVDPETEASNESFASSPTVKSTSSDN